MELNKIKSVQKCPFAGNKCQGNHSSEWCQKHWLKCEQAKIYGNCR